MKTKLGCLVCALLLLAALASPALSAPPAVPDHLRAFGVLPPGQNGFVTIGDVLGGTFQPHVRDQLDMYAGLIEDDDVTEDELDDHFKSLQFGPGATIEREYQPRADVTVFRDNFGVPHIYGDTDESASFAMGYVSAEDRLWQMDVFRHAAKGELASLLGPGDDGSYLDNDRATRRDSYTTAEHQEMLDRLAQQLGDSGVAAEAAIEAYVDGVNARIAQVKSNPELAPAEYQGGPIVDWSPTDVVAVVVFQLRSFGDTGGGELFNAALFEQLRKTFPSTGGLGPAFDAFDDFLMPADPNAYTTIPKSQGAFPSQSTGQRDLKAVAIPDNPAKLLKEIYGDRAAATAVHRYLGIERIQSNFLAVDPAHSATDNTLEFGAPQVGYLIPEFFMELDVHSPSYDFRGPAVPGASVLIPLGRGIDYAWSLTTGVSDNVDTRMELLCKSGGGKASVNSDHYMFKGKCTKMEERPETIQVKTVTGMDEELMIIQRTVHGPVRARTTVEGKPVAVVQEMSFWGHELDSVAAFSAVNSNQLHTPEDFIEAMEGVTLSFNTVFANNDHIAYLHGGRYPVRAKGVDGTLPVWGTGKWEWKGFADPNDLPRVIDPEQGWFANWNNKPSAGWRGGDSSGWGPTHRVKLLEAQMKALLDDGKATLSDVVDVIRTVATQDARAAILGPRMLKGVSGEPAALMSEWIDQGAHRIDLDDDGNQDFGPAVVIFDEWFERLARNVFDDELGGHFDYVNIPISDDPRANNGSAYYADFSNYLWNLFGSGTRKKLARDYCDDLRTARTESCASQAKTALAAAIATLKKSQGSDMSAWTKPIEKLHFSAVGGVDVPDIDWQNRGTWNHAVEVTGSR